MFVYAASSHIHLFLSVEQWLVAKLKLVCTSPTQGSAKGYMVLVYNGDRVILGLAECRAVGSVTHNGASFNPIQSLIEIPRYRRS